MILSGLERIGKNWKVFLKERLSPKLDFDEWEENVFQSKKILRVFKKTNESYCLVREILVSLQSERL